MGFVGFILLWQAGKLNSWQDFLHPKPITVQTVKLNLSDADALSKGSAVRFLGVPVGVVRKVSIVGGEAQVQIQLEKASVVLPVGAHASVASYGLAGSRSLDFEPPSEEEEALNALSANQSPYKIERSIRTAESMRDQLDVARLLQSGAETLDKALFKTTVPELRQQLQVFQVETDGLKERQRLTLEQLPAFNQKMHLLLNDLKALAAAAEGGTRNTQATLNHRVWGEEQQALTQGLKQFNKNTVRVKNLVTKVSKGSTFAQQGQPLEHAQRQLKAVQNFLQPSAYVGNTAPPFLEQLDTTLQAPALQRLPLAIEAYSRALKPLNEALEQWNQTLPDPALTPGKAIPEQQD
jgi:ABC-type transporter Mla subunit MlaD